MRRDVISDILSELSELERVLGVEPKYESVFGVHRDENKLYSICSNCGSMDYIIESFPKVTTSKELLLYVKGFVNGIKMCKFVIP